MPCPLILPRDFHPKSPALSGEEVEMTTETTAKVTLAGKDTAGFYSSMFPLPTPRGKGHVRGGDYHASMANFLCPGY